MPRTKKNKNYFGVEQETAFLKYLYSEDTEEKEKIYNNELHPAFAKMVESIIRRYRLYIPEEEYKDTFDDALSDIMTKVKEFKPGKNKKAYSYFGTICKRYLMSRIIKFKKQQVKVLTYDSLPTDEYCDNEITQIRDYSDEESAHSDFITKLIDDTTSGITKMVEDPVKYKLTDDEVRVGQALVIVLTNWHEIFEEIPADSIHDNETLDESGEDEIVIEKPKSNKYNKSSILYSLKELTCMTTNEIRTNMKKYKKLYNQIKEKSI